MNIQKNSPEWNMMRDLYNLYDAYLSNTEDISTKVNKFERAYKNVPLAISFMNVIDDAILERIRKDKK